MGESIAEGDMVGGDRMIISVASGKGGTGKTLVATSLVLSLSDRGRVQLLDCDVANCCQSSGCIKAVCFGI